MDYKYGRGEQRQNLNISEYAWEILEEDLFRFNNGDNMNGFINKIFMNSYESSPNFIVQYIRNQKEQIISKVLAERGVRKKITPDEEALIDTYLSGCAKDIEKYVMSIPNGHVIKLRLTNEAYDTLYEDNELIAQTCRDYLSQGKLLKGIIEDYARKTYYEREAIIYKDILDTINNELDKKDENMCILKVNYQYTNGTNDTFEVKPYRVTGPWETLYHYLICLSRPISAEGGEYKLSLMRFSRINSISAYKPSHGKGNISAIKKDEINRLINKRGITFILSEPNEYTVSFTPGGIKLFNSNVHLRPTPIKDKTYTDKNGNTIMSFDCSEMQMKYYFFKFGKDATILEPKSLADEFKKMYEDAAKNYK